jgi:hypothetical protein
MSEITRRGALGFGAALGVGLATEAFGAPAPGLAQKMTAQAADESSGPPALQRAVKELNIDVSKARVHRVSEARGGCFFSRMSPDPSPGRNTLTISGLPAGTRGITAWVTEWSAGDKPHAGGAFFYTHSVQLYDDGKKCRVVFDLDWGSHLPAGAQVIFC